MTNKDLKQRLAEDMLDNLRGTMKTEDMLKVVIHHEKTVLKERKQAQLEVLVKLKLEFDGDLSIFDRHIERIKDGKS